jgi:hypothetical protein
LLGFGLLFIACRDHGAVQDAVRACVRDRIALKVAEWDKTRQFPKADFVVAWLNSAATVWPCPPSGAAPAWTT